MADYTERSVYSVSLQLGSNTTPKAVQIPPGDVLELFFIEDIESYFLTGNLKFVDRAGILADGHITGNEGVIIVYKDTQSEQLKQINFLVFKAHLVVQAAGAESFSAPVIEMSFVDPTYFYATQRRYSKSWKQETIDNIIYDIYQNMMGMTLDEVKDTRMFELVDDSGMAIDFIMPYWTPLKALRYLSHIVGGYLIWPHATDDSVYSVKMGLLTYNHIFSDVYNTTAARGELANNRLLFQSETTPYTDNTSDIVKDWWIKGVDKFNLKVLRGGRYLGFDFDGKQFIETLYDYESVYDSIIEDTKNIKESVVAPMGHQYIHGDYTLFPNISDRFSNVKLTGFGDAEYDYPDILKPISSTIRSDWSSRYNTQNSITVMLEGKDTRCAGMWVDLEAPAPILDRKKLYSPQLSGTYVIKNLIRVFAGFGLNTNNHICELIRNGYRDTQDTSLLGSPQTRSL